MGLSELHALLNSVYPAAYWEFPKGKAQAMPFITYFEDNSDNFGADNKVYHHFKRISVELYTKTKNVQAERAVEALFDAHDLYWEKVSTHLDDEDAYETIYSLEV